MESLRLLLVILMSQLEVRAPDQEIATDHAQVLSNLLNEVQMLHGKTLSGSRKVKNPGSSRNFDLGDQSDASLIHGIWRSSRWEAWIPQSNLDVNQNLKFPNHQQLHKSTPPRATTATLEMTEGSENQIALTAQALESWGNKRVSCAKTQNGSWFSQVYEQHPNYVVWISARAATASVAMQDFIMYAQGREALERRALRANA